MKNAEKKIITPIRALSGSIIIGVALGLSLYSIEYTINSSLDLLSIFIPTVAAASILIPLGLGLLAAKNYKKTKGILKPVAKNFAAALGCVSLSLLLGAITEAKLYCTYGACSEFAGIGIIMTLGWIPVMAGISALLTLIGVWILLMKKRK